MELNQGWSETLEGEPVFMEADPDTLRVVKRRADDYPRRSTWLRRDSSWHRVEYLRLNTSAWCLHSNRSAWCFNELTYVREDACFPPPTQAKLAHTHARAT
eukprot:6850190-Alexandrium_andersonii.AAC.1